MNEDVNIWILPYEEEILVTDQTGGVPVDACNWPEYIEKRLREKMGDEYGALFHFKGADSWSMACKKAEELKSKLGYGWTIQYDSSAGRDFESEREEREIY